MDSRILWGEHALALRRRNLAAGTIRQRRYLVLSWLRWLEVEQVGVFDADAELVERFLDLVDRAPSARGGSTSHLHMFYKWAIARRYTDVDPTVGVERPQIKPGLPRPIHNTDLQLALVFAHADPRMEAALLLGAVSGLRCCELARLRWDGVEGAAARVMGKGSKERVVPLSPLTVAALDRVERTSEFVLDGWQSAKLGDPGRCASARISRHFRGAGVRATAHQLRHRAATEALRECHDLRKVQTLLGHANVATTALYTLVDSTDLRGILVEASNIPSDQGIARNGHFYPNRSDQGLSRNRDFAQRRQIIIRRRPR